MKATKECREQHPEKIISVHPKHKPCTYAIEARNLSSPTVGKAHCSMPDTLECTAEEHRGQP